MKKLKVDIAVCAYNEEKNICDFLNSLINQTYKNFQVLVVDDGSTDNTLEKITEYKNRLNIRVIEVSHIGLRKAREMAVNNCDGDIIITLDADEILDSDCIFQLIKPFDDPDIWATGGNIISLEKSFLNKSYSILFDLSFNIRKKNSDWLSGGCIAYRREAIEKIGGLSTGSIGEDVDASWKIKQFSKKIILLDNAKCFHKDPTTLKKLLIREYNVGSRAKNLYFKYKKRILDMYFLYRFSTLVFLILLLIIPLVSVTFFILTLIIFLFKTKGLKYRFFEKINSWFLLNLLNLFWTAGFSKSLFKNEK